MKRSKNLKFYIDIKIHRIWKTYFCDTQLNFVVIQTLNWVFGRKKIFTANAFNSFEVNISMKTVFYGNSSLMRLIYPVFGHNTYVAVYRDVLHSLPSGDDSGDDGFEGLGNFENFLFFRSCHLFCASDSIYILILFGAAKFFLKDLE